MNLLKKCSIKHKSLLTRWHLIVLRMKKRIFLKLFPSCWTWCSGLRCFRSATATCVRQAPANTTGEQKHKKDKNNNIKNWPVAIRFCDAPVEENVGHPESIANAGSRLGVTRTMSRTIILTDDCANFTYWWSQNAEVFPELFFKYPLHILSVHDWLRWSVFW